MSINGGWDDDDLGAPDLPRGGPQSGTAKGGTGAPPDAESSYAGGGMSLGDDEDPFAEDLPGGPLELDLPPAHTANAPRPHPSAGRMAAVTPPAHASKGGMPAVAPPTHASKGGMPAVAPPTYASSGGMAAVRPEVPPREQVAPPPEQAAPPPEPPPPAPPPPPSPPPNPAAIIARYPAPPEKVRDAPGYALRVLWRQLELRQDLATLRKRRSPDVRLYEEALRMHDPRAFGLGMAITCAIAVVATFLFFLPVILRFLRD